MQKKEADNQNAVEKEAIERNLALAQLTERRCDNVVTSSWLTLSQRCGTVENESCGDVGFRHCDNVAVRRCQDVATTSLQH